MMRIFRERRAVWIRGWRNRLAIIVSGAALLGAACPALQASRPTEYEVEAAYLYDFSLFVQWPPADGRDKQGGFEVCVLGADPFGRVLDTILAGQMAAVRNVFARRITAPEQAAGCRILFISSSEDTILKEVLASMSSTSVLTVSDMPHFVDRGGMIEFVSAKSRIRFKINLAAAQKAHLVLSSQLVKLAVSVDRRLHEEE